MKFILKVFCVILIFGLSCLKSLNAEELTKIEDNSFLIEEAYNQEKGIIQHIQTYQYYKKSKNWLSTFVQEWPIFDQKQQFSYSIPVTHIDEGSSATGLGDIGLNYRYQLIDGQKLAISPRLSLILPTGDYKKGLGTDTVGYQTNLPVSIGINDHLVNHWNMGYTFTPNSREASGAKADTNGYNAGTSLVWLISERLNFLTELAWSSTDKVNDDGSTEKEDSLFINPGLRYAVNFKSGLQIVPGLSMPIGVGPSEGEYGILVYLSFEHPLF